MSMMVRRATDKDIPRVADFYAERGYGSGIGPHDRVFLAERDGELAGIVRLVEEEGVIVLRGMQVHPRFQRQGIGSQLLAIVAAELDANACFCIPYAHLVPFYRQIGFQPIEAAQAARFLRMRLESYQNRRDGNDYLIMHRAAGERLLSARTDLKNTDA